MRLLIVVQRYGVEVFGGAEQLARMVAEQFHRRGDDVHVVTSRALSHATWADWYPPGDDVVNGVPVHRLHVSQLRDQQLFAGLSVRLGAGRWHAAPFIEDEWMRLQGPDVDGLEDWLRRNESSFDVAIFFTYLYATAWKGLHAIGIPSVLQPTAHDEPMAYLTMFDELFRLPDAYAFISPEEQDFVARRYRTTRPARIVGVGIEPNRGEAMRFRNAFNLNDDPYLLCVGRTEPGKGSVQLFHFFRCYKERHPGPLRLVFLGEEVFQLPRRADVVMTGFVDESIRNDALAGATALVQPSFFESFSMVLAEGWANDLPALVQGRCAVLAGHARRSGGAFSFSTYGDFETGLDLLLESEALRKTMGRLGREYVEEYFRWDQVLDRYDSLFDEVLSRRAQRVTLDPS